MFQQQQGLIYPNFLQIMVFDKAWFEKYQKSLLWFANTKLGRYILRIHGNRSDVGKNKIYKIEPHAITWELGHDDEKITLSTEFRTEDKFSKRLFTAFKPFWYIIHFLDWLALDRFSFTQPLSFGFSTLTTYTQANGAGGATSGTGNMGVNGGVDESLTAIRADQAHVNYIVSNDLDIELDASATSNQFGSIFRAILTFDTSSLTNAVTVSSATLSISGGNKNNGLGKPAAHICSATPAGNVSPFALSDFSQIQTTSFGSVTYDNFDITGTVYNDFVLNASGVSNVSKTGISKFGFCLDWDLNNNFTGVWISTQGSYIDGNAPFGSGGASFDPKLVVIYVIPAKRVTVSNRAVVSNRRSVSNRTAISNRHTL